MFVCDPQPQTNFNPRSHEGSDGNNRGHAGKGNPISIRAPTRGATSFIANLFGGWGISIRAPTRGATWICTCKRLYSVYFNPRSHEGSDHGKIDIRHRKRYFNPRSHEGSDEPSKLQLMLHLLFQSALPRGERHIRRSSGLLIRYFNPRSHEGSDKFLLYMLLFYPISIRAPTRGATMERLTYVTEKGISIRAPTRGATLFHHYICKQQQYFNPRSHEGSDK